MGPGDLIGGRFAIDVTRVELRRWDAQTKIYELGESAFKEVRNLCYQALTSAGEPSAEAPQL